MRQKVMRKGDKAAKIHDCEAIFWSAAGQNAGSARRANLMFSRRWLARGPTS